MLADLWWERAGSTTTSLSLATAGLSAVTAGVLPSYVLTDEYFALQLQHIQFSLQGGAVLPEAGGAPAVQVWSQLCLLW